MRSAVYQISLFTTAVYVRRSLVLNDDFYNIKKIKNKEFAPNFVSPTKFLAEALKKRSDLWKDRLIDFTPR